MIGHPLGASLAGGGFNMPLFLAGVGLAGAGVFLGRMSDSRLARSVKAYHAALMQGMGFEGGWAPHGGRLGLRMTF